MKPLVCWILFLSLSTSCSFVDPITKAQELGRKGKFQEAIKVLEDEYNSKSNSVPIKSLLAQAYSDYGLVLCQDQNKPPKIKYPMAKEMFSMALALNPYLKEAKEMYDVIEKIQASFRTNNVE